MILAAGLSPAWQQTLRFDHLELGGVNRCRDAYWCGSGKVLNVGVALHHLCNRRPGGSLTISTLGGATFAPIDREMEALGVPCRWIRTAAPTRVCTTLVDEANGNATELVENAGAVTREELAEFERQFAEAARTATAVVLTGSLPSGVPAGFFRQLLEHVHCPAVLDVRGAELLAALDAKPAVVKPNRQELAATLGRPMASDEELLSGIEELRQRGAQSVVVTSGGAASWVSSGGQIHRLTPPTVHRAVNPIGCGDCLAAGLGHALGEGLDMVAAVTRGMTLAADNLQTLLPSDFDGRRARLETRRITQ